MIRYSEYTPCFIMVFTSNNAALGIIIPSDRNLVFWIPCSVDMFFMCSCCHRKYCLNDFQKKSLTGVSLHILHCWVLYSIKALVLWWGALCFVLGGWKMEEWCCRKTWRYNAGRCIWCTWGEMVQGARQTSVPNQICICCQLHSLIASVLWQCERDFGVLQRMSKKLAFVIWFALVLLLNIKFLW